MRKPLTEMQRAFIDWCIAYSKFEIVDSMSISMVSAVANSYDFVAEEAKLDRYGYCTPSMIRWGKSLFPDPPGSPRDRVSTMLTRTSVLRLTIGYAPLLCR